MNNDLINVRNVNVQYIFKYLHKYDKKKITYCGSYFVKAPLFQVNSVHL